MAKPTIDDTRWGVTTGGVDSTNLGSGPDSQLKDDGYADDDIPSSRDWNFWHRKAHAWFKYLDALIDGSDHWAFPSVISHRTPMNLPTAPAALLGTATRPGGGQITLPSATAVAAFGLMLPVVCHITQLVALVLRTDNTSQVTIALKKCDLATGTISTVASATLSGSGSGSVESLPVSVSYGLTTAEEAWVEVSHAGGSGSTVFGVNVFP